MARSLPLPKLMAYGVGLAITALTLFCAVEQVRFEASGGGEEGWQSTFLRMEHALLDMRFRLRGTKKPSGKVGVLAIDDASISQFGRWPFSRHIYKQAFQNLKGWGVEWLGFDVVFSEPQPPLLEEAIPLLRRAWGQQKASPLDKVLEPIKGKSSSDTQLAQGISQFGNVVQGYFYEETDKNGQNSVVQNQQYSVLEASAIEAISVPSDKNLLDYKRLQVFGVHTNTPHIASASPYQGFFNNSPERDGIIRWVTLVKVLPKGPQSPEEGLMVPSLNLQMVARFLQRDIVVAMDSLGLGVSSIVLQDPTAQEPDFPLPIGANGKGRILLNHYGPGLTFPHVSLADAYNNRRPEVVPRLLVMGGTGTGINDIRPSPFDEGFNGVEHHAAAIENILHGDFLTRPAKALFGELAFSLTTGLLLTAILTHCSSLIALLGVLGVGVGFFFIDWYFLFGRGTLIHTGLLYGQWAALYGGVSTIRYFTVEKEKKHIRNAFQHYLNPEVINSLVESPDKLKISSEKKELTVFFSDIRGFTTLSETLPPEKLAKFLNAYFTPMTRLILDSGGLLDKYIGDAIMAVWGAPLPQPNHAERAVRVSVQMIRELKVLKKKWELEGLPSVSIGIGINTGAMSVGNMGSDQRFDYTVLGDAVNLGSRLEGITKVYGVAIVISEFTKEHLVSCTDIVFRELDTIVVKGRTTPVAIFEVMVPPEGFENAYAQGAHIFAQALQLYRQCHFGEASQLFSQVAQTIPDDGPSAVFIERCQTLLEEPPPSPWDGVWVMKEK